ncbi:superoxide dismutase family protein [Propionivibrio dicarboxylicus]|uniref:Superoxide dismutase [Cu-Zn] n=1 Tax=Propionivibrio dicarboxylicus TaxID=83767 RepID=A0A1G8IF82_9RHOO|nr:superoxide dismutase family protein [Propionivibrio dicarboxylicus]SDI17553.1 superoxide dismutase, Cu-Zn family [Propionivibrio dicarboxylicus]
MKMRNVRAVLPLAAIVAAILAGCAGGSADRGVEAVLKPTQGNSAQGTVLFRQDGDAVVVTANVTGLTPGAHGFHIHEKGDCSAPDATSAGGHFNPGAKPHGHPEHGDHHAGDMPMLVADASGAASLKVRLPGVSVGGEAASSILGRGVIVHAVADDFKTQPTGNSGARVACGVIAGR